MLGGWSRLARAAAAVTTSTLVLAACSEGTPGPVEDPVGFDTLDDDPTTDGTAGEIQLPAGDVEAAPPPPATRPDPQPADETPSAPPADAATPRASAEPFAVALTWDGIDITLPSSVVELVGFHESNHDGARDISAYEGRVAAVVMESRERGTGPRSAADIVVAPDTELRAPVTGTVKRAGTYTLYCDELDDFLVIEPTGRPGIEVKLLHVDGVLVRAGDDVVAGLTPIAPRPTILPFESQVDEYSAAAWPHVHLEVVDTAIPDIPNENSGSDDC